MCAPQLQIATVKVYGLLVVLCTATKPDPSRNHAVSINLMLARDTQLICLGSALTAAGRQQESVENYACVLKIDPLNLNQREINKILAEFHANPDKVPEGCGSAVRR